MVNEERARAVVVGYGAVWCPSSHAGWAVSAYSVRINHKEKMTMEKLNPQPEPPSPMNFPNLIQYIIQWIMWLISLPFQGLPFAA